MSSKRKGPKPVKRPTHTSNSHSELLKQQREVGLILFAACQDRGGEIAVSKSAMYTARKWQDRGDTMNVYFRNNDDGSVTITNVNQSDADQAGEPEEVS